MAQQDDAAPSQPAKAVEVVPGHPGFGVPDGSGWDLRSRSGSVGGASTSPMKQSGRSSSKPPSRPPSTYGPALARSQSEISAKVRRASGISDGIENSFHSISARSSRRFSSSSSAARNHRGLPTIKSSTALKPPPNPLRIRDFGFPPSDPRHIGERDPNAITATNKGDVWEQNSPFGQDVSLGGANWSFMAAGAEELEGSRLQYEADEEQGVDASYESGPWPEDGTGFSAVAFEPGALFVAAFAFQAEAESEMNLQAGDIIRVHERICDGWVVASKIMVDELGRPLLDAPDNVVGLCPENYLTPRTE